jgi:hypothetical protein
LGGGAFVSVGRGERFAHRPCASTLSHERGCAGASLRLSATGDGRDDVHISKANRHYLLLLMVVNLEKDGVGGGNGAGRGSARRIVSEYSAPNIPRMTRAPTSE